MSGVSASAQGAEEGIPIRELSRQTGVNTVTLRAWERRYGLLVPQRTPKGHRVYRQSDIERVNEIQAWLARGLAVSKVRPLLGVSNLPDVLPTGDSHWLALIRELQALVSSFRRQSLQHRLEEIFSLYPPDVLADQLFVPLCRQLTGAETGKPVSRAFFEAVALEVVTALQYRQRQNAAGDKRIVVSTSTQESPFMARLFSYSLLIHHWQVEYLPGLSVDELLLGCSALDAKIVVLIGYEPMNLAELSLHLRQWRDKTRRPLVLLGDLAVSGGALVETAIADIGCCQHHQRALAFIKQSVNG